MKSKTSAATSIPCKTGHIKNVLENRRGQMGKDPQMHEKYARVPPGRYPQRNGARMKANAEAKNENESESEKEATLISLLKEVEVVRVPLSLALTENHCGPSQRKMEWVWGR